MSTVILIILLIQGAVFGFFCSYIAKQKGREAGNWFVLGFAFSFLSLLALIAIPNVDPTKSSATPAGPLYNEAETEGLFEFERDIKNSSYQLFLTRSFGIERNVTLEKFTIRNDVFDSLEDALRHADSLYGKRLASINDRLRDNKIEQEFRKTAEAESVIKLALEQAKQDADQEKFDRETRKQFAITSIILLIGFTVYIWLH